MFKNLLNGDQNDAYAMIRIASLLQMKADSIIRGSVHSSGFQVPLGLHNILYRTLLAGFSGDSPDAISTSLNASLRVLRDSSKLASLTLFHVKEMVSRNMISNISLWDEPTNTTYDAYKTMLPHASTDLAVRLMLEKPITADRWNLSPTCLAFDSIATFMNGLNSQNKMKFDPNTKKTSSTTEDIGFFYQYLIALDLVINPLQLSSIIGFSSALATSGSITNYSIELDAFATFCHALINVPAHTSVELLRASRTHFSALFGSIPDSYELKYIEELIPTIAPFDIFKCREAVNSLFDAPLYLNSATKIRPLFEELLSTECTEWIESERSRLDKLSEDINTAADLTLVKDGILSVPRDMRMIAYIRDYNSFDRPLDLVKLKNQSTMYATTLEIFIRRLDYQTQVFNLEAAKKLNSTVSPTVLMQFNHVYVGYDPGIWSETVSSKDQDTVVYGVLRPTSSTLKYISNRLSFVYGKGSVLYDTLNEHLDAVHYDEDIRRDFAMFFESWAVQHTLHPSHIFRGDGNYKLPLDKDILGLLADIFSVSKTTFLELIQASPKAIATILSSFGVLSRNKTVIPGYGRPYGLTYEGMLGASTAYVEVDNTRGLMFHFMNFSVKSTGRLVDTTYSLGKTLRSFEAVKDESSADVELKALRFVNLAPFSNMSILPINDAVMKPSYLITNKKITLNDGLFAKLSEAKPFIVKSSVTMFSTAPWKALYGSEAWDLKKTVMPAILSQMTAETDKPNPEMEKVLNIIEQNVMLKNDLTDERPETMVDSGGVAGAQVSVLP